MPGKVNQHNVAVTMVCVKLLVIIHITLAGSQGQFELNVFKPLIAHNILQSIDLLSDIPIIFLNFIKGIKADLKNK